MEEWILCLSAGFAGSLQGLGRRASDGGANIHMFSHNLQRQVFSQPGSSESHQNAVSRSLTLLISSNNKELREMGMLRLLCE